MVRLNCFNNIFLAILVPPVKEYRNSAYHMKFRSQNLHSLSLYGVLLYLPVSTVNL